MLTRQQHFFSERTHGLNTSEQQQRKEDTSFSQHHIPALVKFFQQYSFLGKLVGNSLTVGFGALGATGFFTEREHPSEGPIVTFASPLDFEKTKTEFRRHAPRIGEDGPEVLREAGYDVRNQKLTNTKTGEPLTVEVLIEREDWERIVLPYKAPLERLGITMTEIIKTEDSGG